MCAAFRTGPALLLAVLLAGCGGAPDTGRVPGTAATTGDAAAGPRPPSRLGLCASCHGTDGLAVIPDTPDLAGRDRDELLAAMQAYLDGTRDHAPMRAMLGPIRPAERERLAEWFASRPPAGTAPAP